MRLRYYVLLAFLGWMTAAWVVGLQQMPGYMDASYYCATGLRLAGGQGFTEPFLWNYLDDPAGLPHPSHAYWMPLASLLAAAGAALGRAASCTSASLFFVLLAGGIPPLAAALSWSFSARREHALLAGLLAAFPAFYTSYLPVTDTFTPYMLLGGLFFLVSRSASGRGREFLLGFLAGLMHLTRADGLLWLIVAWLAVFLLTEGGKRRAQGVGVVLAGYLLVMAPWFLRNWLVFGAPLGVAGSRVLWLTAYDQMFSYPADRLTFSFWWASGLGNILRVRLWALGLNLASTAVVQGEIFLWPFVLMGLWSGRREVEVRLALVGWLLTLLMMTLAFPFAGARGSFFHSGSAFQVLWWVLTPQGLERIVAWLARRRSWQRPAQAQVVFRLGLVGIAILLTGILIWQRSAPGSDSTDNGKRDFVRYEQVDRFLTTIGAPPEGVIVVADPPTFYLASGRPSIVLPDGDVTTLQMLAERYHARYLVLEKEAITTGLKPLYERPDAFPAVRYLGEVEGARVFVIQP